MVEFKFSLDDKIQARKTSSDDRDQSNVHAIPPFRFIQKVIPFWTLKNAGDFEASFVDPNLVIGATYKKFEKATVEKCLQINDDDSNVADYEKIGDLPLYVAIEGKNRVRLFQKYQVKIKARIRQIPFPPPNVLQLHRYWKTNNYFLSCSSDFYVQGEMQRILLLYPKITVPLLKSYGVREEKPVRNVFFINKKKRQMQEALESASLQQ